MLTARSSFKMLWLEFSLFFLSLLGALGEDDCDAVSPYTKCLHHVPREKINKIVVVPNIEELMEICPGQLNYLECFTDHLDDCGRMSEHYTVVEFMESTYEIAKELCDENSNLHQEYAASVECYKTLEGTGGVCSEEAKLIYEAYLQYLREEHPERLDAVHRSSQQNCMTQSYKIACLSEKVLKVCGEVAQSTMMEIASRSQYLRQFCSQSMIEELTTEFLQRLNKTDEDLEMYESVYSSIL